MRVVHVITGLDDGGAEAVLYRLCKNDEDYEHVVISLLDRGKYGSLLEEIGIPVYVLNMRIGLSFFLRLNNLRKLIKELKPDVIQTWMYHADLLGGLAGRLAGVRNITWGVHHTTLVKGRSQRLTILVAKLNAFLSGLIPKNIIYCAQKSREVQESIGFNKNIGFVVSNGYEIQNYKPDMSLRKKFRNSQSIHDEEFLIGHVGRYDPQKDHKNLISALGILKKKGVKFKSVIIGTNLDDDNKILKNLQMEYDLDSEVRFLGRRDDIPSVMNGINLFVLSSSFGEAFPNVLNEAMACGTPCVTTDVGDAALIVGETGWVVPPKDPQALADAIMLATQENQKDVCRAWLNRKHASRERIVENFSIEKMIDGYHRVWSN